MVRPKLAPRAVAAFPAAPPHSLPCLPPSARAARSIALIGALPYGAKWLLRGEVRCAAAHAVAASAPAPRPLCSARSRRRPQRPARQDAFEQYLAWKPTVFDATAPYAGTREMSFDRAAMQAEWAKRWAEAGPKVA